jgi:hypothetical protein
MDDTTTAKPLPKTTRINPGDDLIIRMGAQGDVLLSRAEYPPGIDPRDPNQTRGIEPKLTTILVMSGDPNDPSHPVHALRRAVAAYLESLSRGRQLGPLWKEPVTSKTTTPNRDYY